MLKPLTTLPLHAHLERKHQMSTSPADALPVQYILCVSVCVWTYIYIYIYIYSIYIYVYIYICVYIYISISQSVTYIYISSLHPTSSCKSVLSQRPSGLPPPIRSTHYYIIPQHSKTTQPPVLCVCENPTF